MKLLILLVITLGAGATQAQDTPRRDVLLIERVQKTTGVNKPGKGMSMAQVEKRFGTPQNRHAAVGEPPISRWIYADFTVYFEHQHVIHSVINKASPTETPGTING